MKFDHFAVSNIFRAFAVLVISAAGAYAQAGLDLSNYGVRIEPDKRLLTVLAALEMARGTDGAKLVNTSLSKDGESFRVQLDQEYAGLPADLRTRITTFVAQHKKQYSKQSDAELVSPFISMAFSLSPAPELADPSVTTDLPGNLLDVLDFAPLAREFYRRSGISAKLDVYIKQYQTESDGVLRSSTREMVSDLLEYLHTRPQLTYIEKITVETAVKGSSKTKLQKIETKENERRFVIVPEMLAPTGNINFVNIKDDYFVILPPGRNVSNSDVRRAYLRFVIDPLVLKSSKEIATVRDAVKALLEERRKVDQSVSPDVFLTMSRSLIAAIDARQEEFFKSSIATDQARKALATAKVEDRKKITDDLAKLKSELADEAAAKLSEDYEKGAVLAFYFAEELRGIEDSGFDIASSLSEMIVSCDPTKEKDRLAQFAEARKRAAAVRASGRSTTAETVIVKNPVTTRLLEIDKTIDAKDYAKANAELKELLVANPSEARIYYSMGRLSSLVAETLTEPESQFAKLLEAKNAYSNVIRVRTSTTDPALLSQTFVNLGRIYEFEDNPSYAIKLYDEAIKISDVTGGAYKQALEAKQRLVQKPQ